MKPRPSNTDPLWHLHAETDVLYHYTTRRGLAGILSSQSIWFTDVRYLNDASELTFARRVAIRKLQGIRRRVPTQRHYDELTHAIKTVGRGRSRAFAFSLSVWRDDLNQWLAYATPPTGFAIGFNYHALEAAASSRGLWLKPVVYSPGAQHEILDRLEIDAVRAADEAGPLSHSSFADAYLERFVQVAPFIKHPAFVDEGEWRLVPRNESPWADRRRYRHRYGRAIPYLSIPFNFSELDPPLLEVITAPSPNRRRRLQAARRLLAKQHVSAKVSASDIPYRSL